MKFLKKLDLLKEYSNVLLAIDSISTISDFHVIKDKLNKFDQKFYKNEHLIYRKSLKKLYNYTIITYVRVNYGDLNAEKTRQKK